jgi:DNA-binding MarR family transcriptional regulator
MQQQALSAIVAWVRLDSAIQSFNQALRKDFGITGLQLAVLRILGERPSLPLAALRKSLVMHPATLGQSIDELRTMGLCTVERDGRDKRARVVAITDKGKELMSRAPMAGPVRLRAVDHEVAKLDRLKAAFEDSVEMFGLADYLPKKTEGR